jgi:uncharacterized protein (UPF0216 family)
MKRLQQGKKTKKKNEKITQFSIQESSHPTRKMNLKVDSVFSIKKCIHHKDGKEHYILYDREEVEKMRKKC